jgi:hypothetical protein
MTWLQLDFDILQCRSAIDLPIDPDEQSFCGSVIVGYANRFVLLELREAVWFFALTRMKSTLIEPPMGSSG